MALSSNMFKKIYFEIEKDLYLDQKASIQENHVFITGMARSGTSIMLNAIYESNQFASFTYQEMPFILAPNLWSTINKSNYRMEKSERAHGDGIWIDNNSPEAFEEIFWNTFGDSDQNNFDDFNDLIRLICLRQNKQRYLSKNNQNIKRVDKLINYYPNSRIVIPFRDPIQHCYSLLNQHKRFLEIQKMQKFVKNYMFWIGHREFGMDYLPSGTKNAKFNDYQNLNHWLEQWLFNYNSLKRYKNNSNVKFCSYENLCNQPEEWSSLLRFLGIPKMIEYQFKESKKKITTSHDNELLTQCNNLYTFMIKSTS